MKQVTIGLKLDEEFLRYLNVNVELSRLAVQDQLEPIKQLALVALLEARGALEEQVHTAILPCWRNHLEVVSELRKVEECI